MKMGSESVFGSEGGTDLAPAKRGSAIGVSEARMVFANLRMAGLGDGVLARLVGDGYLDAPASNGHHLDVPGGLALHSLKVTDTLVDLGDALGVAWPRAESPYLVGMLHDLVKMYNYEVEKIDGSIINIRRVAAPYPGHGAASVQIAGELGIELTPEETSAITWHMGAFGMDVNGDTMKSYKAAVKRFPRAIILTHAADFLASVQEEGGAK